MHPAYPFYQAARVLRGAEPSLTVNVINGHNAAVGATWEDITDLGSVPVADVAAALTLASSSSADTAAGAGARTVLIEGLAAAGLATTALVALAGTTPVAAGTWLHINRISGAAFGSGATNAGAITATLGGQAVLQIVAGFGISQSTVFRVPADRSFLIGSFFLNTQNGTNSVHWRFGFRLPGSGGWLFPAVFYSGDEATPVEFRPSPPATIYPGGTILKWQAQAPSGSVACSTGMVYSLVS